MPSWLCVETNFHVDRLSPNEGWPFCVQSGTKPNYIRVHGPYEDDDPLGLFGSEKCDNFKIIPSNTEYPSDDKYPEQKANPKNWTTRGWYALCPYNQTKSQVVASMLDYPPTRTQCSKAVGPYDTKEEALEITKQWDCAVAIAPAEDVCDPNPRAVSIPTLECSLACSSLGWPFMSGTIMFNFFKYECYDPASTIPSPCLPQMININLGCRYEFEPMVTHCWYGSTPDPIPITLVKEPPRGTKVRFYGRMCVDADPNYVNVSVQMEALMLGIDIDPSKPSAESFWTGCGTFGGKLKAVGTSRNKRHNRIYTGEIVSFIPSCAGLSECIKSVVVTVVLLPWKFGCDGGAGAGRKGGVASQSCGLFTDTKAYTCATVQKLPLDPFYLTTRPIPVFGQLGLNGAVRIVGPNETYSPSTENGCMYCIRSGATYICDPTPVMGPASNYTLIGIPGETTADWQQIQMFEDIMLKRISGGGLYVAVMYADNAWTWKPVLAENIIQTETPMIIEMMFPVFNLRLLFYMVEFPSGLIAGCVTTDLYPPLPKNYPTTTILWSSENDPMLYGSEATSSYIISDDFESAPEPFLGLPPEEELQEEPIAPEETLLPRPVPESLRQQIQYRFSKKCLYLGNEKPDTGCCGSSNKFECSVFGECRKYGRPTDGEPICVTCPEYKELIDAS